MEIKLKLKVNKFIKYVNNYYCINKSKKKVKFVCLECDKKNLQLEQQNKIIEEQQNKIKDLEISLIEYFTKDNYSG